MIDDFAPKYAQRALVRIVPFFNTTMISMYGLIFEGLVKYTLASENLEGPAKNIMRYLSLFIKF